jgi:hypothetical protein
MERCLLKVQDDCFEFAPDEFCGESESISRDLSPWLASRYPIVTFRDLFRDEGMRKLFRFELSAWS